MVGTLKRRFKLVLRKQRVQTWLGNKIKKRRFGCELKNAMVGRKDFPTRTLGQVLTVVKNDARVTASG